MPPLPRFPQRILTSSVMIPLLLLGGSQLEKTADQTEISSGAVFGNDAQSGFSHLVSSIPRESPGSSDQIDRFIARATLLDSRLSPSSQPLHWQRVRISNSPDLGRKIRIVELWIIPDSGMEPQRKSRDLFLADQLIVRTAKSLSVDQLTEKLTELDLRLGRRLGGDLVTLRLADSSLDAIPEALDLLANFPEYFTTAEPDGIGFGAGIPNDPDFNQQWGLHNAGQNGGSVDADVDGPDFWDIIGEAPDVLIAVLDSGLNFTHPDLIGIAWQNPGEIPDDGIDNDGNGKVDDVHGWDFTNNDNDATDDQGHGSHVTGIIAANRDDNEGVAGMIGGAGILVGKVLNDSNSGLTSDLIAATTYAREQGVHIMNLSLQNYPYSSSLNSEFTSCETAGILLSICAGNQGVNNDSTPNYPSSYPHSNIIAVGNHERNDVRWSGSFNPSNYGPSSVDLFAPGRLILSPILGTSYSLYTGTSQAAPFVTGVAAAIKQANPSWTAGDIKASIMDSVITRSAYSGICVSGGRLNAVSAISASFRQQPEQDSDADGFSNFFEYLTGNRIDLTTNHPVVTSEVSGGNLLLGVAIISRPDAHLTVERSTDLIQWHSEEIIDFSTSSTLLGGTPLSGSTKAFLRIRAVPSPLTPDDPSAPDSLRQRPSNTQKQH